MSLMLRKACQPFLNKVDMDPYHADLNPTTKYLEIKTPCGKRLAAITGILFSSLQPTREEITFATELLEIWLLRNKHILERYIVAFELHETMKNMPTEEGDYNLEEVYSSSGWVDGMKEFNYQVKHVDVRHGKVMFRLRPDGTLDLVTWNNNLKDWPKALQLPAEKLRGTLEFAKKHQKRLDAKSVVERTLAEMNRCDT